MALCALKLMVDRRGMLMETSRAFEKSGESRRTRHDVMLALALKNCIDYYYYHLRLIFLQ